MKVIHVLCFLLTISTVCFAQTIVLDQYIQKGLAQNLHIQQQEISIEAKKLSAEAVKGKLRPNISFESSYLLSNGGRKIDFPLNDLVNPVNDALNQLTNTTNFPTDVSNFTEVFSPNNFQDTRLKLRYAVYNRALHYYYRTEQQLVDLETAKQVTLKQNLIKDIKIAYYQYFKLDGVIAVLKQTQTQLGEVLNFNEKLVKYNQKTEDILFQITYEIENTKAQLLNIQQQKGIAKAHFNSLINEDLNELITKDEQLKTGLNNNEFIEADFSFLQNQAVQQRPELTQLSEVAKVNEILIKANQKTMLPTLNLEATSGFQGTGYRFNGDQFINTLGFGFNWLIYDGGQRKRKTEQVQVINAKIQKDIEIAQQQIRLETQKYYHSLKTVYQKIKVEQAVLRSAKSRYGLLRKRYENGQILLIELLDAQTKYTNAQLNVEISEYDLLIQMAELERVLGNAEYTANRMKK